MDTPEERLIAFTTATTARDIPAALNEKAVHCFLDAVSLARCARNHPVVLAGRSITGLNGPATLWADGSMASGQDAAFVNGIATHAHFQDDTDMSTWGHPASIVIPAVMAAAEVADESVPTMLAGLIAGYAAMSWLGAREEVSHRLVRRGFRASPTLGTMAAALGAAVVLGLDTTETNNALGIAADSTGGTLEPVGDGAEDWRLQNGFAAQRGFAAALLATSRVRGPGRPLTGATGFLSTYIGAEVPEQWGELPDLAAIEGVWFKAYPILGDNMAPAVAAAVLTDRINRPVAEVVIRMNELFAAYPGTQFRGPFVHTDQMVASTAFNVATVLTHGHFEFADYERLQQDQVILNLVQHTTVLPEPGFGYLDGAVEVSFADGTKVSATSADAPCTRFFRDREETLAVLAARRDPSLIALATTLYAALDGDPWPSLRSVLSNVSTPD